MRVMKSKQYEIKVVGQWTGSEDKVTRWLTENGYVWKIQVENAQQWAQRLTEMEGWTEAERAEYADRRVRLNVLGSGIYEQWSCEVGSCLVLRPSMKDHGEQEGELVMTFYNADRISEGFEDVA